MGAPHRYLQPLNSEQFPCLYTLHSTPYTRKIALLMRFFLHISQIFTTFATQTKSLQTYFIKAFALFEDSFNHPHFEFTVRE